MKGFVFCQTEEGFERERKAGAIDEEMIVFIKDISRIWTHNVFFPEKEDDGKPKLVGTLMIKLDELDGGGYVDEPISSYTGAPTMRVMIDAMILHVSVDVGAEFVNGEPYDVGSQSSTKYVWFAYDFNELYEETGGYCEMNLVYSTTFPSGEKYSLNKEFARLDPEKGVVSDYFTAN